MLAREYQRSCGPKENWSQFGRMAVDLTPTGKPREDSKIAMADTTPPALSRQLSSVEKDALKTALENHDLEWGLDSRQLAR